MSIETIVADAKAFLACTKTEAEEAIKHLKAFIAHHEGSQTSTPATPADVVTTAEATSPIAAAEASEAPLAEPAQAVS